MKQKLLLLSLMCLSINAKAEVEKADSIMRGVVVTGTCTPQAESNIAATVTTVDREQLTATERISVLPTLSELVPSLYVTQRGVMGFGVSTNAAGGINMRGMSSATGQVLVLIDGHPQYQTIYNHAIADAYQTMMAERVEVVRSPSSLFYGSHGMGGVVNIITRKPADGIHTEMNLGAGSYNSIQAEVHNSVRAGRFFCDITLNYQGSDNHRENMDFYQYGCFAKLGYDITANWRVWASADLTHFAASNPGPESAPLLDARQWVNRGVVEATAENHYARTSGEISVYHNFGRHKINDGHTANTVPRDFLFRSQDALTGISAHQSGSFWKGGQVTLGVDFQRIHGEAWNRDINSDVRLNGTREQNAHYPLDKTITEIGVYADITQDITSWFSIEAGVRYDNHSEAGNDWAPQGGLIFKPIRDAQLKVTAGRGFRAPSLNEMYLYGVANPDLESEHLWNTELAWKHAVCGGRITYGANIFYMKASNLIARMMVPELGRVAWYNTGETEHWGAEIEAAWSINKHWGLNTNHSYLHTQKVVLAAPKYKGYLGANYRSKHFEATAGVQYVSGLCTDVATEDKDNFCLVNASVAWRPVEQLKLWVRGENLLAQRYYTYAGYPMPKATVMAGIHVAF